MSQALSFVTLLRVFYTGILLFFAIILLREVWFIWFDRHMTLGEIKYFDGIKVEQAAGDRFRHLLRQESDHDLDHIRNYARIFQTITGRASDSKPSLFRLEGKLEPANLTSAKGFKSFAAKEHEFAALDISFQGIDIKRIFSSVRTYLSPSVDLDSLLRKIPPKTCGSTFVGRVRAALWRGYLTAFWILRSDPTRTTRPWRERRHAIRSGYRLSTSNNKMSPPSMNSVSGLMA